MVFSGDEEYFGPGVFGPPTDKVPPVVVPPVNLPKSSDTADDKDKPADKVDTND